ncbi:MAG TPA: ATP-binding protein [Thermoplasmata archaeon]|nr:ATP-binding protein [Thermoplasmata archaeon]
MAAPSDGTSGLPPLLEAAHIGLATFGPEGTLTWTNPAFDRLLGGRSSVLGRRLSTLASVAFAGRIPELLQSFRKGQPYALRSIPVSPEGKGGPRFVDLDMTPAPPGSPPHGLLVVVDVSERVEDRKKAALFYESFLTSTNPIEVTDASGVLVDVNPAFEKTYGFERSECLGRRPNLVRSPSTPPELFERMWQDLLDPARGYWSGELSNRDRKGRERPVFLTITAIRDDSGVRTHYLGVAVDLAGQKSWERAAAHSDKLASLGQLAAGVAHEINTPLANVMLITESIRRGTSDPAVRQRLDRISGQVEVAGNIVRGLLDFARRGEPQVRKVDLAEVARESLSFLSGKQSADLEFVEELPSDPPMVWGDRGQLIQVVTNIVKNACDAMGGTGRVTVRVRRHDSDAELEVADSGPGIPEDVVPHIFEPFFTTKPEGQGTGLGLAVCHGIVQAHHGTIRVQNRPGGGASFVISLPISTAEPPPPVPRRPVEPAGVP